MTARRHAVSPLLMLLCGVLLGLPRVGLAAEDVPRAEPAAQLNGPEAAAGKEPAPEESWGRPERYRAPRGLRVLTGVGTGLLTSVAGGAVLGLAGYGLCAVGGVYRDGFFGCDLMGYVGALLGVAGGYGLGVWWGGELMGGDGRLLFSLLGATAGAVVSGLVSGLVSFQNPGDAVLVALPLLLGSHLGYELSQRAPRPSLQPVLAFSAHGARLGLGGSF